MWGLLLEESIEQNIAFSAMQTNNRFLKKIAWMRIYDRRAAGAHAEDMVKKLDIRCTESASRWEDFPVEINRRYVWPER